MATLIIVEDHARVGRAILTEESFPCDGDALTRARELLSEEETRRRGVLPALFTLWVERDDGTVMGDAGVRREAHSLGGGRVNIRSALESGPLA